MDSERVIQLLPIDARAARAILFLVIEGLCVFFGAIIEAITAAMEMRIPEAARETNSQLTTMYLVDGVSSFVCVVVSITSFVFFFRWMYRAYLNSLILVNGGRVTTAMTKLIGCDLVLCWWIPIYSMFRPFQYVSLMWKASDMRGDARLPNEIWIWLAVAVIGQCLSITSIVMIVMILRNPDFNMLTLDAVSSLLYLASIMFVTRIVSAITERQQHKIHALQPGQ